MALVIKAFNSFSPSALMCHAWGVRDKHPQHHLTHKSATKLLFAAVLVTVDKAMKKEYGKLSRWLVKDIFQRFTVEMASAATTRTQQPYSFKQTLFNMNFTVTYQNISRIMNYFIVCMLTSRWVCM